MTIVTTHYRYKRPPRKRKAAALDVRRSWRGRGTAAGDGLPHLREAAASQRDRHSQRRSSPRRTRIVGRFGDVPDMTPEEHKRRGDAADALFREMKRQIAASKPVRGTRGAQSACSRSRWHRMGATHP